MIVTTVRQLPAILAPPGAFFWPRRGSGFAGGGLLSLFVWAGLIGVRAVVCLLTGKVILRTEWRTPTPE